MASGQVRLSIFCGFRVGVVDVREADKRQSNDGNVHLVELSARSVHVPDDVFVRQMRGPPA